MPQGKQKSDSARDGSKAATILERWKRPGGATSKELMKATGWQPHSVRGFLSGTIRKKMGRDVISTKGEVGSAATPSRPESSHSRSRAPDSVPVAARDSCQLLPTLGGNLLKRAPVPRSYPRPCTGSDTGRFLCWISLPETISSPRRQRPRRVRRPCYSSMVLL